MLSSSRLDGTTRPSSSVSPQPQFVYSRREKAPLDAPLDQSHNQSSSPVTGNPEVVSIAPYTSSPIPIDNSPTHVDHSTSSNDSLHSNHLVDDLDLPIAMRRAPRTCPLRYKYPTSNYVSPHRLSPSYRAFANQLSYVPHQLQDALIDPK